MPRISVILPTCRRPALLRRAVGSILAQTLSDFEIIVVDNNTAGLRVSGISEHTPWLRDRRVRLVEAPTAKNPAGVRNIGLEIARGDWVTFLDDDDKYHPNKIELQLKEAERSRLEIGLCKLRYCVSLRRRVRGGAALEIAGDELLLGFPGMPAVLHRRSPPVRFNELLYAGEDLHYFQLLLRHFNAATVFNVPVALVDVYVQSDAHVNLNSEGNWKAAEVTLHDFGESYSAAARRVFRLRARLAYCKFQSCPFPEMLHAASLLLREGRTADWRFILNCFLYKLPFLRCRLIS
jgi:glycosyltransferase involved in cell wall biosynthesis